MVDTNTTINSSAVPDQDTEHETSTFLKIPAAILSYVAIFLPNHDKVKLSLGNLYFNQAMQWHFRLLINQSNALNK